jgi:hypothetical protein
MERAGLLMRAGENCCKKKGDKKDDHDVEEKCHGRLATLWGKSMAKKYKDYPFDTAE